MCIKCGRACCFGKMPLKSAWRSVGYRRRYGSSMFRKRFKTGGFRKYYGRGAYSTRRRFTSPYTRFVGARRIYGRGKMIVGRGPYGLLGRIGSSFMQHIYTPITRRWGHRVAGHVMDYAENYAPIGSSPNMPRIVRRVLNRGEFNPLTTDARRRLFAQPRASYPASSSSHFAPSPVVSEFLQRFGDSPIPDPSQPSSRRIRQQINIDPLSNRISVRDPEQNLLYDVRDDSPIGDRVIRPGSASAPLEMHMSDDMADYGRPGTRLRSGPSADRAHAAAMHYNEYGASNIVAPLVHEQIGNVLGRSAVPAAVSVADTAAMLQTDKPWYQKLGGLALRGVGAAVGGALGFGPVGIATGAALGGLFSRVVGVGKYQIARSIRGKGAYVGRRTTYTAKQVPTMHSSAEAFRFQHREYLGDLYSGTVAGTTTPFTTQTFFVNAGLPGTFPFMSSIAGNFQKYRINGLVFTYKPTSVDSLNSTNTALGKVIMSFQYNPLQATYTNELEQANAMWSSVCKPSESMSMPVECSKAQADFVNKYVRLGGAPSGTDLRMYDYGYLQVSTVGMQGSLVNLGEIWASYDVTLMEPTLQMLAGAGIDTLVMYNATGVAQATPFGTAANQVMHLNTIGATVDNRTITFPAGIVGTYWVIITWETAGAGVALTYPTFSPSSLSYTNTIFSSPEAGITAKHGLIIVPVSIVNPSAASSLQLGVAGSFPTDNVRLWVTQVNLGATLTTT